MTANPYESPEKVGYTEAPKSNLLRPVLWFLGVGGFLLVLVALLLPATRTGGRESVRRIQCSNNLKQIGIALQNYHDEFQSLPPAYIADADGKPMHSWRVSILPYLEQKAIYDKYNFNEPWDGPNNSKLHNEYVYVFCCPSRRGQQAKTDTSYVAVSGPDTAWPAERPVEIADFTDGTSDALMVVELANSGIHWMEPRDLEMDRIPMAVNQKGSQGISSDHPNVALALFADGHTAALTSNTPADTIRRLLTIADGEPVGDY